MKTQTKQITMNQEKMKNIMREIEIEKLVLNCGATGEKLDRSVKLLAMITGEKITKLKSTRRIPSFGISPGKESGAKVTLRDKEKIISLCKRFFAAFDNKVKGNQVVSNHLSFGVKEYIEVPGMEYLREIGILGFEGSLVFTRKGKRVKQRKVKQGKYPKKQAVTKEEIVEYLTKTFKLEVVEKNDNK